MSARAHMIITTGAVLTRRIEICTRCWATVQIA